MTIISGVAEELLRTGSRLRDLGHRLLDQVESPAMTIYSQRDPRWRDEVYAGGMTFGSAGCYVTCVAMVASLAGYEDEPLEVARELRRVGAFSGALLVRPNKIPEAYPLLQYAGLVNYRSVAADMERIARALGLGPVILEVEFRPGGATPPQDQHFVVGEALTPDGRDMMIVDPWDGSATRLLERYALDHWDLARAIYGLRLLRVGG